MKPKFNRCHVINVTNQDIMMKLSTLAVLVIAYGTGASADATLTSRYTSLSGSANGVDAVSATGVALSYTNVTDSNLTYLGSLSHVTGSVLTEDFTGTVFGVGIGYAYINDINFEVGTGSRAILGLKYSKSEVTIGGLSSSSSDFQLAGIFKLALAPKLSAGLSLYAPTDSLGDVSYNSQVGYMTNFGEINIGVGGSSSNAGNITQEFTTWSLGITNSF